MRAFAIGGVVLLAACSPARDASNLASGTPVTNVVVDSTLAASTPAPIVIAATPAPRPSAAASPSPAPKRQLTVTASGYGLGTFGFGYAFTIRNENLVEAAEAVSAQIAWQDAYGTVLATASQSIAYLGPGEHTGIASSTFSSSMTRADAKMSVQILPGKWTPVASIPTFTFSKTAVLADTFGSKITGVIKSPFSKDLRQVRVSAIGVDAKGQIVGGGSTYVDFVPAAGTTAVSVSYSGAPPANVALYAQVSSLSLLLSQ